MQTDLASITTEADGSYMMAHSAGTIFITASASGYDSQTQQIEVEDGIIKDLDFSLSPSPPAIENVTPSLGEMGSDLVVTLHGTGFDNNTRVSMYLDTGGKEKIIGSVDTTGSAYAVDVNGNTAYVATGNGLEVIDISNPAQPSPIKTVNTTGSARDVVVAGNTAYVVTGGDLEVFDISNPTDPTRIEPVVVTPGSAQAVAVAGNIAYVGDDSEGLTLIDVDPDSTDFLSIINTFKENCVGDSYLNYDNLAVNEGIAYVAGGCIQLSSDKSLQIINVEDPENIEKIGSVATTDAAQAIAVYENIAYVADNRSGLQIIDVDPTPGNANYLKIIEHVKTTSHFVDVNIKGNTLYIAASTGGLKIIDIDPNSESYLMIIGSVDTPSIANGVSIVGSTAYVADQNIGLQIIDVSTPSPPTIIGTMETPGHAHALTVSGNIAYLADESSLQVVDVNPSSEKFLEIIGSVETPGAALAVAISGTTAYVADTWEGLQAINLNKLVSDPQNAIIGTVPTTDAKDVVVIGSTAYVADGSSGLRVINVSDPNNLDEDDIIASVGTSGDAQAVTVIGNIAYVANGFNGGLKLIDLTKLAEPNPIIGTVDNLFVPSDVVVIGTIAYVADDTSLQIIDVDPTPGNADYLQIIGSMDIPAYKITVTGNTLYVVGLTSAVQVIDISDPSTPALISTMDIQGYASDVIVNGSTAYVTDRYRGPCCPSYEGGLTLIPVPVQLSPTLIDDTKIAITLPSPMIEGNYTLRAFNNVQYDELFGAVTFTENAELLHARAIIAAGGGPDATGDIWEETKNYAQEAYNSLIFQGYKPENIYYMTDDGSAEGRDAGASRLNLQYAVTDWANDDPESKSLVLYLVDHGEDERFQIRGNSNPALSEYVTANELDTWLDSLQSGSAIKVLLVYDACFSGSFVSNVRESDDTRVVITSVDDDEVAYFLDLKQSFSGVFWGTLSGKTGTKGNLYNAWTLASGNMANYQSAQLDANGNGVTNEPEDVGALEQNIFEIGRQWFNAGFSRPVVNVVAVDQILTGETNADLSAWGIYDLDRDDIVRVWAEVIAPDFVPSAGVTITALPFVDLADPDVDGTYEADFPNDAADSYPGFTVQGTYIINYFAEDSSGLYSEPKTSLVIQQGKTPVLIPDQYEDDDTANQAQVIVLNHPSPQDHSFHDTNDEDWVKFYGLAGEVYSVKAMNPTVISDPMISIYSSTNLSTPAVSSNTAGAGTEEFLKDWTCPTDGLYYVRITNNSQHYGANVRYKLKVYNPIAFSLPGYIKGKITSGGKGVSGAVIRAGGGTAITLPDGSFILCLKPGTYSVSVSCNGYQSTSFSVSVGNGQSVNLSPRDMNSIPQILNSPPGFVKVNELYDYTPVVIDANGDPLTFSITDKPAWASFSTVNGRLWGRPSSADEGTYGPITIKVSDNAGASDSVSFNIKVMKGDFGFLPSIFILLFNK